MQNSYIAVDRLRRQEKTYKKFVEDAVHVGIL